MKCNICGGTEFGAGPNGRMAVNNTPPYCHGCASLERQRILRRIFQAFPLGFLDQRRALKFGPPNGMDARWFQAIDVVNRERTEVDMQALPYADASYDFVAVNHTLEFVADDHAALSELLRVLTPQGVLEIGFSNPVQREICQDFPATSDANAVRHLYGRNVLSHFDSILAGLSVLVVEETDPCTGVREVIHLIFKDTRDAGKARKWLQIWGSATVEVAKVSSNTKSAAADRLPQAVAPTLRAADNEVTPGAASLAVAPNGPPATSPAPGAVSTPVADPPALLASTPASTAASTPEVPVSTPAVAAAQSDLPTDAFTPLREELAQWQKLNRPCPFWWRDDDLIAPGKLLDQMANLAQLYEAPVLVAVIPALAQKDLASATEAMSWLVFCQHGLAHKNYEPTGTPNAEFWKSRALAQIEQDIRLGHSLMSQLFGKRFFPVFVPPWNRLQPSALPFLKQQGFIGLSQFPDQPRMETPGVHLVNTHIDILDWSSAPQQCHPTEELVARLAELLQQRRSQPGVDDEPIGILSHHRVMRDDAWLFMENLLRVTREFDCVDWLTPSEVFTAPTSNKSQQAATPPADA